MRAFLRQLGPAVLARLVFTVLCGLIYPLVVTGDRPRCVWHDKANGSLIKENGVVVGSSAHRPELRRSASTSIPAPRRPATGYDGLPVRCSQPRAHQPRLPRRRSSSASPPTARRTACRPSQQVPVDAVTASASGLDPDISVANAKLQAPRVATARGVPVSDVLAQIDKHTTGRTWGILGEPGVNVLELNLALDGH